MSSATIGHIHGQWFELSLQKHNETMNNNSKKMDTKCGKEALVRVTRQALETEMGICPDFNVTLT